MLPPHTHCHSHTHAHTCTHMHTYNMPPKYEHTYAFTRAVPTWRVDILGVKTVMEEV